MIEVKNLTKRYGDKKAVDNISFTVNDGEILGFLGPNGAGKSTTMNIITGYSGASDGTVTIDGKEIFADPIAVKSQIGYLPEQPPLYLDMTVSEYLNFMYDLKKVKLPKAAHIAEVCAHVKITDVYNRVIKNLSKGYRQRVGLAQAILGNPSVLILDEPTVGLDPKQIIEIRNLIKDLGEKYTVILSSHILSEVQATCERVIVINKGRIIADNTPDKLSQSMNTDHKLSATIEGPYKDVTALLKNMPHIVRVERPGKRDHNIFEYAIETEPGTDIRKDLFYALAKNHWPLLGLRSSELTLEEIFLQLTSDDNKIALNDNAEQAEAEDLVMSVDEQAEQQPAEQPEIEPENNGGEQQ